MLVSQKISNLLNGVSQRPPSQRFSSQAEEQINGLSSVAQGARKRPPLKHVGMLTNVVTGWDDAFVHPIKRTGTERYHIVVANGQVFAFDAILATPVTVLAPSGSAYLNDPTGADFRATTIGDTTMIVNRGKIVKRSTAAKTSKRKYEALVFVRQADFSTRYAVTLEGITVAIRTVDQNTAESRVAISTDAIATDLLNALKADTNNTIFTFTQFGSTIHIFRNDDVRRDFTLDVSDGLADQGLKSVKGSVQSFEDLPARAPNGFIVEITGTPETKFDNYFVKYDDADMPNKDGVWRECVKPGSLTAFDATTMPHRLTRKGSITRDVVNAGVPTVIGKFTPLSSGPSVTYTSWAVTTPGDVAIAANTTARLSDHNTGVKKTITQTVKRFFIRYDLDASKLESGVNVWVRVYKNSVKIAERNHKPGELVNRLFIQRPIGEVEIPFVNPFSNFMLDNGLVNTDVLEVKLEYETGVTPTTYRRATLSFDTNQLILYSAVENRIEFTGTVYPAGSTITVTLDGIAFNYAPGASDKTAIQVGQALYTSIDAHANYVGIANSPGNILDIKRTDGAPFTSIALSATFSDTTLFHNPALTLVSNEHVGRTIKNLTDGSSGTITANGATTITVGALTGGAENKFQPGDACTVVGTGQYFVFEPCPWKDRAAGDDETAPFPSFVDSAISEVFFHQNRIGFLSNENVVLSSSGDLFNFFRYTVTDLRADDLIDVRAANEKVTIFHSAVLWNEKLTLWSDNAQFALSGDPVLTPTTVRLDPIGAHPNSQDPRPVVMGEKLYFTRAKSGLTQVFEFALVESGSSSKALEITSDTPTYISGAPLEMIADAAEGFLALLTTANTQKNLYIYKTLFDENKKVQSSLSRWEFAAGRIVGLDFIDGVLGLVHKHADGAYLSVIDLDLTPDAAEKVAYLDRRLSSAAAVHNAGTTTWTLPYSVATNGSEGDVIVVNRTTKAVYTVTRPLATTVAVAGQGDLSAASVYIGVKYKFTYRPSTIYMRRDDVPVTTGRLQIRYLDVFYRNTTDFTVTVTPQARTAVAYAFAVLAPFTDSKSIAVMCRNENVTIEITSDSPGACALTEIEWEGFYTNRSKQV